MSDRRSDGLVSLSVAAQAKLKRVKWTAAGLQSLSWRCKRRKQVAVAYPRKCSSGCTDSQRLSLFTYVFVLHDTDQLTRMQPTSARLWMFWPTPVRMCWCMTWSPGRPGRMCGASLSGRMFLEPMTCTSFTGETVKDDP